MTRMLLALLALLGCCAEARTSLPEVHRGAPEDMAHSLNVHGKPVRMSKPQLFILFENIGLFSCSGLRLHSLAVRHLSPVARRSTASGSASTWSSSSTWRAAAPPLHLPVHPLPFIAMSRRVCA